MIEKINESGYVWNLNAYASITFVEINGVDVSDYLVEGTTVGWYDVSKNSGRELGNANGKMILNIIADKYRIDLVARPLSSEEFITFFAEIRKAPVMSVKFLNPWTGTMQTIECYRGDRLSKPKMPLGGSFLYTGPTQALIEL